MRQADRVVRVTALQHMHKHVGCAPYPRGKISSIQHDTHMGPFSQKHSNSKNKSSFVQHVSSNSTFFKIFFFFLVDIYKWDRYNSTPRFQEKVKKKHKTAILPPPIFTLLGGQIPRFHGKCDFLLHFQTLCREDHKGKCEGHKTEAFCLTLDHSFGVQTVLQSCASSVVTLDFCLWTSCFCKPFNIMATKILSTFGLV